jgi:hypothetical protein
MAEQPIPADLSPEQIAAATEGRPPELPEPQPLSVPPPEGKPPVELSAEEIRLASEGTSPDSVTKMAP